MKHLRIWLPIVILVLLGIFLAIGLQHDPRTLPSVKIGKPVPTFKIPVLGDDQKQFTPNDMLGKVWVLNVFASWCVACQQEHQSLFRLIQSTPVNLVGLAYKDAPVDTKQWLEANGGNPYQVVAEDLDGNVGIDFGVYGVPESYVIDRNGIIRYRQVGPIPPDFYAQHVQPIEQEAQANNADGQAFKASSALGNNMAAADVKANATTSLTKLSEEAVEKRVRKLAEVLRCLVCQNQTVADSNAALAIDLRRQIAEQVRAGKSDDEIKAYMIERYGEFVLYDPPLNLKNIALWVLPFVLMLIGFYVAWRTMRASVAQADADASLSNTNQDVANRLEALEAQYQDSLKQ